MLWWYRLSSQKTTVPVLFRYEAPRISDESELNPSNYFEGHEWELVTGQFYLGRSPGSGQKVTGDRSPVVVTPLIKVTHQEMEKETYVSHEKRRSGKSPV